jgi:hypothetical protein
VTPKLLNRGTVTIAAVLAAGLGLGSLMLRGQDSQLQPTSQQAIVAVPGKPAALTATLSPDSGQAKADGRVFLTVAVAAYAPPPKGALEAIVKVATPADPTKREIGRFGVFPNAAFNTEKIGKPQRFRFEVPTCKADETTCTLNIEIEVVSTVAESSGAQMIISDAILTRQ